MHHFSGGGRKCGSTVERSVSLEAGGMLLPLGIGRPLLLKFGRSFLKTNSTWSGEASFTGKEDSSKFKGSMALSWSESSHIPIYRIPLFPNPNQCPHINIGRHERLGVLLFSRCQDGALRLIFSNRSPIVTEDKAHRLHTHKSSYVIYGKFELRNWIPEHILFFYQFV